MADLQKYCDIYETHCTSFNKITKIEKVKKTALTIGKS